MNDYMTGIPKSQELIAKIREEVKAGKPRGVIAAELGINIRTIYKYTDDLPKRKLKKLSKEERNKMREERTQGMSIRDLAKKYDVHPQTIYMITRDLTEHSKILIDGRFCIKGSTARILQEIDKNGYITPNTEISSGAIDRSYRTLINYIPNIIRKVSRRHHVIIFYETRKIEAFRAFMGQRYNRIVSWNKYRAIMSAFHICKPAKESRELLGKMGFADYEHPKRLKFKKIEEDDSNHQNLSDFGRFLLADVLLSD